MPETSDIVDRISRLADQGKEDDLRDFTPGERIAMVWPLTLSVWAMKGKNLAGERLQRDVDCVRRREHAQLEGGQIPFLCKADLLANKLAAGRPKYLLDAAWLNNQE